MRQERREYTNYAKTAKRNTQVEEQTKDVEERPHRRRMPVAGTVSGCSYLCVREKPEVGSKIVKILNSGATINVNLDRSTDEFYAVSGGYCMRDFITIGKENQNG